MLTHSIGVEMAATDHSKDMTTKREERHSKYKFMPMECMQYMSARNVSKTLGCKIED